MSSTIQQAETTSLADTSTPAHAVTGSELMQRIARMAITARGKSFSRWPAWSSGENLMVALVLNNTAALDAMNYTILEALDRVELSSRQLQQIARRVL